MRHVLILVFIATLFLAFNVNAQQNPADTNTYVIIKNNVAENARKNLY